jgi:phage shock protein A
MVDDDRPDPEFDAMTARLLRREALRRAAEELNTTSGPGLESVLARISAEVTAEAAAAKTSPAARERSPRSGG